MTDVPVDSDDFDPTMAMLPPETAVATTPPETVSAMVPPGTVSTMPASPLTGYAWSVAAPASNIGMTGVLAGNRNLVAAGDVDARHQVFFYGDLPMAGRGRTELSWTNIYVAARSALRPPGIDTHLAQRLAQEKVLVLAADRGEGRHTATMCLLDDLAAALKATPRVVRQFTDDRSPDEQSTLNSLIYDWGAGTVVLLDLVPDEPRRRREVLRELKSVTSLLTETGGYLVITIPRDDEPQWQAQYPAWVVALQRPDDAMSVATATLRDRVEPSLIDQISTDPWFAETLREAWPPRARHVAELVITSCRAGFRTLDDIRSTVEGALDDWAAKLRASFDEHAEAWYRTMLLALGLLEGAEPGTIVSAARGLIAAAGYTELDDPHPLLERSAVARVTGLGEVTANVTAASFRRPEFGGAVLPNVWRDFPDLRDPITTWLSTLPFELDLGHEAMRRFTERVHELAMHQDAELISSLAVRWTAEGKHADQRVDLTAGLLASAAADDQLAGRVVRAQLYHWAYHDRTSHQLRIAIAKACGSYGPLYPRNALTRLKQLARSADADLRKAVVASVTRIAAVVGPHRVLGYLADWLNAPEQADALVEVVGGMLNNPDVQRELDAGMDNGWSRSERGPASQFWRRAYDRFPFNRLDTLIRPWLAMAADLPQERGDRLVELLVTAAGTDLRRVGNARWAVVPRPAATQPGASRLEQLTALLQIRFDELATALPFEEGEERAIS